MSFSDLAPTPPGSAHRKAIRVYSAGEAAHPALRYYRSQPADLRCEASTPPVTNRSCMARRSAARLPCLVGPGLAMVTLLAHRTGARSATIADRRPAGRVICPGDEDFGL